MLVLLVKIVNFLRVGLNVVGDASILKISRVLPEPLGPTTDMKSRSFVKMILFIVLGLVVRNQLLPITDPPKMTCLHRKVYQVQFSRDL